MMHHTRAVILRKDEWGEADWIVSALCEDFGKLRLLCRGGRRHGAKLQGHLEPGSVSSLSFVVGRNGHRLTAARLLGSFPVTRDSLPKIRIRDFMLATFERNLFPGGDQAEEFFRLAHTALAALESFAEDSSDRLFAWFIVRFVRHLGLFPASDAREAGGLATLLDLALRRPEELARLSITSAALQFELIRLSNLLEGSVILPRALPRQEFAV